MDHNGQSYLGEVDVISDDFLGYVTDSTGILGSQDQWNSNLEVLHGPIYDVPSAVTKTEQAMDFCYPLNTGGIPSRDPFQGEYDFFFLLKDSVGQQQSWVYSQDLKQVFIQMNKTLLVHFNVNLDCSTINSFYIRALPVYTSDDHVNVPVARCTMHSVDDDPQGKAHRDPQGTCLCHLYKFVGHVVRSDCHSANYIYDLGTERHSVRVPITLPEPGSDKVSIPFSFSCKTSCPKGMMRRPIDVIFTLEDESGQVFGRQKLCVKICSCPKRDKKRQEDDYFKEKNGENPKKRRKLVNNEDAEQFMNTVKIEAQETNISLSPEDLKNELNKETDELRKLLDQKQKINEQLQKLDEQAQNKLKRIEEIHSLLI